MHVLMKTHHQGENKEKFMVLFSLDDFRMLVDDNSRPFHSIQTISSSPRSASTKLRAIQDTHPKESIRGSSPCTWYVRVCADKLPSDACRARHRLTVWHGFLHIVRTLRQRLSVVCLSCVLKPPVQPP